MMHIRNIDWVLDLWEGNCLFYLAGGGKELAASCSSSSMLWDVTAK